MGTLEGRVALVTGASRGLGEGVAKALAREGAHVLAAARSAATLAPVVEAIRGEGGSAESRIVDLEDADSIRALVGRTSRLDVLVLNGAMFGGIRDVVDIAEQDWERLFRVNVTANLLLLQGLHPLLAASPAGRVIAVGAKGAYFNSAGWSGYSMTKAALDRLIFCYAWENQATSIRANVVSPGPVNTAMWREANPGNDPSRTRTPEQVARLFVAIAHPDFRANARYFNYPDLAAKLDDGAPITAEDAWTGASLR
jgi:NAD(P)-dependent dehydrogenase (short-subunit alcohol dehydrogenase family)